MQNIQAIHFYPIKGLQGFKLQESFLRENKLLINDRKFAIAQSLNENNKISWLPKSHFKQLVNQPSLARVRLALL